jgi:pyruvate/2-oxoacid:ferredoxin oxidoreductase alpha subunit
MKPNEPYERAFPLAGIDAAMRRAAIKARELSERTNTPFIVFQDGNVVDLLAQPEKGQEPSPPAETHRNETTSQSKGTTPA